MPIKILPAAEDAAAADAAWNRGGREPSKFEVSVVAARSLGALRRAFSEKRPDAVHAHGAKAAALARLAAGAAGLDRVFVSPRGGGAAASGGLMETAAAWFGAASVPVDFRVYSGAFPEPKAHDGLVVGSLGDMTGAHRVDEWVLLAQRLCDSRNGLACLWIGGGPDEAQARTHLANMNLLMKVEVTGTLSAGAARERLRGLDLFVHYARAGAPSEPIRDAMACGLPVVASDVPANRALVEDGVTGCLVKSEVELLERCQALVDDGALRRRLGDAGRERLRRDFSLERRLSELSRLYADRPARGPASR